MAVLTDAEARRMLELLKEALSPKSITLNKGEKQFQLHQISCSQIIDIIRVSARLMHMAQCGGGCRQPYRNSRNAVVKRSVHEICSRGIVIV